MLQVFAVEGLAAGVERRRNDETVVVGKSVAPPQVKTAAVEPSSGVDKPERYQHVAEQLACLPRCRVEPAGDDIDRFLNNLVADAPASLSQILLNQTVRAAALVKICFIEQIDEDVGVKKVVNAHSSHPA